MSNLSLYDEVAGVAVNMPRGHSAPGGPIKTRWPKRGIVCAEALQDVLANSGADGLVAGFAEFPKRALEPLRANNLRISRAAPTYRDPRTHETISNAVGWFRGLNMIDSYGIKSDRYEGPNGWVTLSQPVRLFRTPRSVVCVVQLHPPTRGDAPASVRNDLIEKVVWVAKKNESVDICTLLLSDTNSTFRALNAAGFVTGRAADVQRVMAWGMDFRGKGGAIKSYGVFTDHRGGSPWAVARVPVSIVPQPRKLPDYAL